MMLARGALSAVQTSSDAYKPDLCQSDEEETESIVRGGGGGASIQTLFRLWICCVIGSIIFYINLYIYLFCLFRRLRRGLSRYLFWLSYDEACRKYTVSFSSSLLILNRETARMGITLGHIENHVVEEHWTIVGRVRRNKNVTERHAVLYRRRRWRT